MTSEEKVAGTPPLSISLRNSLSEGANNKGVSSELPSSDIEAHDEEEERVAHFKHNGFARKCWSLVTWTPKRCRWDLEHPPPFSLSLNLLFAFVRCSIILSR